MLQVDPPADHKDYLHRAGRTARAGGKGVVVTESRADARAHVDAVLAAGLSSESEGAEPHRYVVVLPADEEGVDEDAEDAADDSASEQA